VAAAFLGDLRTVVRRKNPRRRVIDFGVWGELSCVGDGWDLVGFYPYFSFFVLFFCLSSNFRIYLVTRIKVALQISSELQIKYVDTLFRPTRQGELNHSL
jgi:hypothetical protein